MKKALYKFLLLSATFIFYLSLINDWSIFTFNQNNRGVLNTTNSIINLNIISAYIEKVKMSVTEQQFYPPLVPEVLFHHPD